MLLKSKTVSTLVVAGPPLSDNDITSELKSVSERQWSALTQLLDQSRQEFAASAARCAVANNALSMASDSGAYEALSGLIELLNERRVSAD